MSCERQGCPPEQLREAFGLALRSCGIVNAHGRIRPEIDIADLLALYEQALKDFPPITEAQKAVVDAAVDYIGAGGVFSAKGQGMLEQSVTALKTEEGD